MADRPRLVIGAGIIDSVEGGSSTSTIDLAVLSFPIDTGLLATTSNEIEEVPLRIRVKRGPGETTADVRDRVQEVLDLLDTMTEEGLTIEYDSGQELIVVDPADVANLSYRTEKKWGARGCLITVTLEIQRIDSSTVGTGEWQIQRNTAGRSFIVGRLTYANLAIGVADVALMRSGASRPAWMSSACRVVEDTAEAGMAKGNVNAKPATDFRPVTLVVAWEQMASHMANSPAFADVKKATWTIKAVPREPLNVRSGYHPGLNVTISFSLEFKTEQNTSYDAADSSVLTSSTMHAKAVACAQVILAEAERRGNVSITPLADYERNITGEDGVYQGTIEGITGGPSRVTGWNETETFDEEFRGLILEGSDGSEWEFEHNGGDLKTIIHSLEITSIGGSRSYLKPSLLGSSNWRRIKRSDDPPQTFNAGEGVAKQYKVTYRRTYRFVNPRGGSNPERESVAGASPTGGGFDSQGYFTPSGPDV